MFYVDLVQLGQNGIKMISSLITLAFAIGVSYLFYQKRKKVHFCLAAILYAEILPQWPFYLSPIISFGIISLVLAGLLFFEGHSKKEKVFFSL